MRAVRMNQNTEATGKHQNKELKHFEMLFSAELVEKFITASITLTCNKIAESDVWEV